MEIRRYTGEDFQYSKHEQLLHKIALFIKDTFQEIEGFYPPEHEARLLINDMESLKKDMEKDSTLRLYIVTDTEEKIRGCLWGSVLDDYKSDKRGLSHLFFVKYIARDRESRKQGIENLESKG